MALNAGDPAATGGLAREIYEALDAQLRPALEASLAHPAEQLPPIQNGWKTLSYCIASGVVEHLERNPPTETEFAQTFTSSTEDAAYWTWLSGLATALQGWSSSGGTVADLQSRLNTFFGAHATPTRLTGVLR